VMFLRGLWFPKRPATTTEHRRDPDDSATPQGRAVRRAQPESTAAGRGRRDAARRGCARTPASRRRWRP
jgi:hypothetical protein